MADNSGSSSSESFNNLAAVLSEPWRAVCPKGHQSWYTRGDGFVCRATDCEVGEFDALVDAKTGERVIA
jgi:hypothetical protein